MKKASIIGCFILFLLCLSGCNISSTVEDNNAVFSEAVKATSDDIISLNELAAFEWDIAYTFTPNTPKENIEKIIGVSSGDIKETYNESQTQLIFVKDDKVVCSIWGYGNNLGYWIFFRGYDGDYLTITPNDDVSFSVDRSGEEIILTYIQ
ncbi:MAG: hypothetical protein FWD23_09910 [Oscillospiraceae bacterium]|nr:hypothetical protein [Oscillospiraceae bacterium]